MGDGQHRESLVPLVLITDNLMQSECEASRAGLGCPTRIDAKTWGVELGWG